MIEVKLNRGKYKIDPEKGLRMFKKKLQKEGILRDYRDRCSSFVSEGRKEYLKRRHRAYLNDKARLSGN